MESSVSMDPKSNKSAQLSKTEKAEIGEIGWQLSCLILVESSVSMDSESNKSAQLSKTEKAEKYFGKY